MARDTTVSLDDHFTKFVDDQVQSGHYGSVSEVVREALRLLEDHQSRLEALRAALIEGEQSGPAAPIDVDEFLKSRHAEWQDR